MKDTRREVVDTVLRLDTLKELPGNANLHNARNKAAIRFSLEKFGQVEPLVVQKSTQHVIGGNGRLAVMREMGWIDAECKIIDVDDATAQALALALNRTSELSVWDNELLSETMFSLRDEGWDLTALGWEEHEYEPLLAAEWSPPEIEPLPEAVSAPTKHVVEFTPEQWAVVDSYLPGTGSDAERIVAFFGEGDK